MWTCWSKCEVHHSWRRVQNTKLGSPCERLSEVTRVPLFVRNVVSCCRLKATVEAVTRWMATSCARAAAHAASRTSRPKSPPTANKSLPEPLRSRPHRSTDSRHIIDSSLFTHSVGRKSLLLLPPHWCSASPASFPLLVGTSFVMFSSAFVRQWPDLQAAWAPLYHSSTPVLPTYSLHMSFYFIVNTFKDNESTHGRYRFQPENKDFFPDKGHAW